MAPKKTKPKRSKPKVSKGLSLSGFEPSNGNVLVEPLGVARSRGSWVLCRVVAAGPGACDRGGRCEMPYKAEDIVLLSGWAVGRRERGLIVGGVTCALVEEHDIQGKAIPASLGLTSTLHAVLSTKESKKRAKV